MLASADEAELSAQQVREWPKHSAKTRQGYGVTRSFAPWTKKPGIRLTGVPKDSARITDLIDIAYIDLLARARSSSGPGSAPHLFEPSHPEPGNSEPRKGNPPTGHHGAEPLLARHS